MCIDIDPAERYHLTRHMTCSMQSTCMSCVACSEIPVFIRDSATFSRNAACAIYPESQQPAVASNICVVHRKFAVTRSSSLLITRKVQRRQRAALQRQPPQRGERRHRPPLGAGPQGSERRWRLLHRRASAPFPQKQQRPPRAPRSRAAPPRGADGGRLLLQENTLGRL